MSESAVSNGNGGGTSGSNGYYLMRRHSRGPSGSPRPSNSTIPPSPTLSSSAAATVSIPSPQDQTINLPDFSNKSKEELIRLHSKLHAELNIKNKIIYDLRARENWVSAELMAAKKTAPPKPQNVSDDFGNGLPEGLSLDSPDFEDAKAKLFQTILQFKKELSKAKQSVEQNANLLRESEKRREAAQDEVNHLQSVIQSLNSGSGKVTELGNQRIQKLESALQTAQNEISSLQSKVSLWARASKKNQVPM
ncbi:hypothetical protein DFJ73DRAFT_94905 [Zopfochytrium polystomum]|nr:hypothetical protein DFJ73DRAFT_94905 [Zopfochytrium polystomum]